MCGAFDFSNATVAKGISRYATEMSSAIVIETEEIKIIKFPSERKYSQFNNYFSLFSSRYHFCFYSSEILRYSLSCGISFSSF